MHIIYKIDFVPNIVCNIQALSTHIGMFFNPQLFPAFKIQKFPCPHVAYSNRIRLSTHPRWYPDSLQYPFLLCIKCVQSMRHKARDSGGKVALLLPFWRHISLLFSNRLDTNLLRHWIRKQPDSPANLYFPFSRADLKNTRIRCRILRMRLDGGRNLNEKVAVSKISGYVQTGL